MSDWQPVRLKSAGPNHPNEYRSGVTPTRLDRSKMRQPVRARLTDDRVGYTCGTQWIVEIHPDDAKLLGVNHYRLVACEHQVDMD